MIKNTIKRSLIGGTTALVALCATSSSALANEFEASGTGATKGHATTLNENEVFNLKPFKVTCKGGTVAGEVTATHSQTLMATVTWKSCSTFKIVPVNVTPAKLEFNADGTAKIVEPIVFSSPDLGKCTVEVPAGQELAKEEGLFGFGIRYPESKKYPHGIHYVTVESILKGVHSIARGYPCDGEEEGEVEREGGSYAGSFYEELVGGQLTFVALPGEEGRLHGSV